jgi:hypothetical protein
MGAPDMTLDLDVQARKRELKGEALTLIQAIESLGNSKHPLTDPLTLCKAVKTGLLDAPDLKDNKYAKGEICTKMINGACLTTDSKTGDILQEKERIKNSLGDLCGK